MSSQAPYGLYFRVLVCQFPDVYIPACSIREQQTKISYKTPPHMCRVNVDHAVYRTIRIYKMEDINIICDKPSVLDLEEEQLSATSNEQNDPEEIPETGPHNAGKDKEYTRDIRQKLKKQRSLAHLFFIQHAAVLRHSLYCHFPPVLYGCGPQTCTQSLSFPSHKSF